jgi:hypothetical protein
MMVRTGTARAVARRCVFYRSISMTESIDQAEAGMAQRADVQARQQLIIGTVDGLHGAARTLDDLQRAGFTTGEVALVARVDGARRAEAPAADRIDYFGEASSIICRGLGTLLIGGEAVPTLRALDAQVSLGELGQALADAGLPDADALIYELGLIRGQCLLAVRAATADRGQVAYRLLLRCGSREVHVYRT